MKIYVSTNSLCEGIHSVSEPLFLNPDGNRTRFPIGWEGKGRYIPGTLRLVRMSDSTELDPATYSEESNGIFFNFNTAPAAGSYNDIAVRYLVRPEDYSFSQGTKYSAYPGEEYFLFPNWNNAKGCGDAFWVGKYAASNGGNNVPVSMKGKVSWVNTAWQTQVASCAPKGTGFHCIRNREWVAISLWTKEMGIDVYGNFNGYNTGGTNIDMRGIGTNITSDMADTSDNYHKILTGTGPDSFRHNGKAGGISDLGGNVWEAVDGLQLRNGVPYILDESNSTYVALSSSDITSWSSTSSNKVYYYINNSTNDLLNEGLPVETAGLQVSNDDILWKNNSGTRICYRGGSCDYGTGAGVWTLQLYNDVSNSGWDAGFRLARAL